MTSPAYENVSNMLYVRISNMLIVRFVKVLIFLKGEDQLETHRTVRGNPEDEI
jgi:hypothetical protein